MTTINNGGPAFPATSWTKDGDFLGDNQGMTLRDYFAAKAMQGLISTVTGTSPAPSEFALAAYIIADAMLKAREVQQ